MGESRVNLSLRVEPRKRRHDSVQWAVASRPKPGEAACGDLAVVKIFPGGALLAVLDGLGASEDAATAARIAATTLQRYGKESVSGLMKRCHHNLLMSHGAALTLASFRTADNRLFWLGLGNVQALLKRANPSQLPARLRLRLYGGVAGHHMPQIHESSTSIQPGDTLILATDGIRNNFDQECDFSQSPQALADEILSTGFLGSDDGLVLVARYLGVTQAQTELRLLHAARPHTPRSASRHPMHPV